LSNTQHPIRALVIADGDVPPTQEVASSLGSAAAPVLVVAADGGLAKAEQLGLLPHVVVGDGDSLAPGVIDGLTARGVEVQLHPTDKEASDTELAVLEAIRRGARQVTVLGALGGLRFDHALANVLLLALPALSGCDVQLRDGRSIIRLVADGATLHLHTGDGRLVSLLPLSRQVEDVTTAGLRFPLRGERLEQGPSRGLSNEITADEATVSVGDGRLAVIQTRPPDDFRSGGDR
jgi:thiamine pyrophosphokinase